MAGNLYPGSTGNPVLERRLQELASQISRTRDDIPAGKQAVAQADSAASTVAELVTDFNALLDKLRDAGLMAQ